ncbi:MAG: D-isomer specific 2-hydroxyacid dehydrogenase family protein [Microgenomates group bacterium]
MKIYLITSNPVIGDVLKVDLEKVGDFEIIDGQKLTAQEVIEKASDAEILIAGSSGLEKISDELLSGLPNLKYISTLTVGLAWVDIEAVKKHGVKLSNVKGANSESVAEHTWAMILDLSKRVTEFDRDVRNKNAFKFAEYTGKEVFEKTIGIIGLGDIGQKIARIAKAFNMKILGVNKSNKEVEGVKLVDLDTLYKESDIIAICTPLTLETENLISDEAVSKMKDGVIIVNSAMEKITNKESVFKGLEGGKIFGFGIETEISQPADPSYLNHPRVIVTPHNAFNTEDANKKTYEMAVENVMKLVEGNPIRLIV